MSACPMCGGTGWSMDPDWDGDWEYGAPDVTCWCPAGREKFPVRLLRERHEHAEGPQANERDRDQEEPELQAEGERAAPGPAGPPMHETPEEQTQDAGNEE